MKYSAFPHSEKSAELEGFRMLEFTFEPLKVLWVEFSDSPKKKDAHLTDGNPVALQLSLKPRVKCPTKLVKEKKASFQGERSHRTELLLEKHGASTSQVT